jgi:hypothetical protein
MRMTSSCSTFTQPSGPEHERLRLAERSSGEPAALTFIDDRRIEALLDGGPDAEGRREREAVDHEVGAVAYAHLVDAAEEVVGGIAGHHVAEPRLDTHCDDCEQAAFLPLIGDRELGVAELHATLVVRVRRVRHRHVHGHVEVVAAGLEGGVEDRRVEPRVAGVDDDVCASATCQLDEIEPVGCVDTGADDVRRVDPRRCPRRSHRVDIGHHDVLERRPASGNRDDR